MGFLQRLFGKDTSGSPTGFVDSAPAEAGKNEREYYSQIAQQGHENLKRLQNEIELEDQERAAVQELTPPVILSAPTHLHIKPLKWVTYAETRIGIVYRIIDQNLALVHFVNEIGETIGEEAVAINDLRYAKHLEIPAARRHPNVAYAASLGYC
jgi:hypothetical protein